MPIVLVLPNPAMMAVLQTGTKLFNTWSVVAAAMFLAMTPLPTFKGTLPRIPLLVQFPLLVVRVRPKVFLLPKVKNVLIPLLALVTCPKVVRASLMEENLPPIKFLRRSASALPKTSTCSLFCHSKPWVSGLRCSWSLRCPRTRGCDLPSALSYSYVRYLLTYSYGKLWAYWPH